MAFSLYTDEKGIFNMAKQFKTDYNTNDPFEIAKHVINVEIILYKTEYKRIKGITWKPKESEIWYIFINDNLTDFSKKIVCAHELGHALLSIHTNEFCDDHIERKQQEYKANIFTASLMFGDTLRGFSVLNYSEYLLRILIDSYVSFKDEQIIISRERTDIKRSKKSKKSKRKRR